MIPLLAAASAISAVYSIASGAASMLQHVVASAPTVAQKPVGGADFARLMAGHGFAAPHHAAAPARFTARLG